LPFFVRAGAEPFFGEVVSENEEGVGPFFGEDITDKDEGEEEEELTFD
jgi:hypothetical protein